MAITLASCSFNENGGEDSSTDSESLALSSTSMESESSRASSSSRRVSLPRYSPKESSSLEEESSSSLRRTNVTYYTVSIYQSYLIRDKGVYGNPRFDFSVRIEAGKPLYATHDELHDLIRECTPNYRSNGDGAYFIDAFYSDEGCKRFINVQAPVISNTKAYYFCTG